MLWGQAQPPVQQQVRDGVLGTWNTSLVPDGFYRLRLCVFLDDGRTGEYIASNLRVANSLPTPVDAPHANVVPDSSVFLARPVTHRRSSSRPATLRHPVSCRASSSRQRPAHSRHWLARAGADDHARVTRGASAVRSVQGSIWLLWDLCSCLLRPAAPPCPPVLILHGLAVAGSLAGRNVTQARGNQPAASLEVKANVRHVSHRGAGQSWPGVREYLGTISASAAWTCSRRAQPRLRR